MEMPDVTARVILTPVRGDIRETDFRQQDWTQCPRQLSGAYNRLRIKETINECADPGAAPEVARSP